MEFTRPPPLKRKRREKDAAEAGALRASRAAEREWRRRNPGPEPSFVYDGVTAARAEYLFALARVCHVPPPVVDALRVADFGHLTLGIDATEEASEGG